MTTYAPERLTTGTTPTKKSGRPSFLISSKLPLSVVAGTGLVVWMSPTADALMVADADTVTGIGGFTFAPKAASPKSPMATSICELRARTRLSWDDLSRLFGVSRRSVHKWASGGAMNSKHARRLADLTAFVAQFDRTPTEVRAHLFAPDERGRTLFQALVQQTSPTDGPNDFSVEQLMGVRREGDVTSHGEFVGSTKSIDWPKRAT